MPSRCSASVEEQLVKHCSKYLLENQIQLSMGCRGFAGGSEDKESACSAGDPGLIPGQEDPLEKGMATHASILAWRLPGTGEPGGLPSMGSHRVGHD